VKIVIAGLGPIGIEVGRALLARGDEIVSAADPAHAGADLSALVGGPARAVVSAVAQACAGGGDVAVLCTGSRLPGVAAQLEEAIAAGLHVVSTCEELAYPWLRHRQLAERLDGLARARGVTVLGTGVNPGLVMDRLPLMVAQACVRVEHVLVTRSVDAARRRAPLRAKVGAHLTVAELEEGLATGRLGHAGLAESAALLAVGLGFPVAAVEETAKPVVDAAGKFALGVRQTARVHSDGIERVRLELAMYLGAEPADRIVVTGDPPLDLRAIGGVHGDRATVGAVVNALTRLARLPRGLLPATA
jgi:2,4-diaminopentanoate dehydrogenase